MFNHIAIDLPLTFPVHHCGKIVHANLMIISFCGNKQIWIDIDWNEFGYILIWISIMM